MSAEINVIQHSWFKDNTDRVWVILNIIPFYPPTPDTEVTMLEFGKIIPITRPYEEIKGLVRSGAFKQLSFYEKPKI